MIAMSRLSMRLGRAAAALLATACLAGPAAAASAPGQEAALVPIRRFALVVGANDGGPGRPRLRFAGADAESFADVMVRFGGLDRGRAVVLRDPGGAELRAAIEALGRQIAAAPGAGRAEVLFYYSGHSDEEGLLLSGERLGYAELRGAIEALPAEVRIAIVDSCASGAMIRAKGGERRAAFLVDRSNDVRGTAVLASASADEAAQESDRVRASYFSHALVTGLRGAADVSGDDRVTLNEAYQFAFAETLGRTQSSALGPQHARYDIQLVGQGDVVLTDLTTVSARLLLDERLTGRLYVRDAAGNLVAELRKPAGRAMQLGLAAGDYEVLVDAGAEKRLGKLHLSDQAATWLRPEQLVAVAPEVARARGDVLPAEAAPAGPAAPPAPTTPAEPVSAWGLSVWPGLSTDGEIARRFSLGVFGAAPKRIEVLGASTLFNVVEGDADGLLVSGLFNVVQGHAEGAQLSTVFNWASADARGFQGSSGFNAVNGRFEGAQVSSGANVTTGDLVGAQGAAGVNIVGGRLTGAQGSAILNAAGGFTGAQLGLLNLGGDFTGAQVGLLNIGGRVRGAQVGLINVATTVDGASVGLVPVVTQGRHALDVAGGELVHLSAAYKIGASHTHGIFGVGTRLVGDERLIPFLGLGAHLPLGASPGHIDVDLLSHALLDTAHLGGLGDRPPPQLETLRIAFGWRFAPHLTVFGGPTLNAVMSKPDRAAPDLGFTPLRTHVFKDADLRLQAWPGATLGIEI